MMTFTRVYAFMACLLALSGCTGTTYSSHFDCPMGRGAGCASVSKVNKLIDTQQIDLGGDDSPRVHQGSSGQGVFVYYGPDELGHLLSQDHPQPEGGQR